LKQGTEWFLLDLFNDALQTVFFCTEWEGVVIENYNKMKLKCRGRVVGALSRACADLKLATYVISSCFMLVKGLLE